MAIMDWVHMAWSWCIIGNPSEAGFNKITKKQHLIQTSRKTSKLLDRSAHNLAHILIFLGMDISKRNEPLHTPGGLLGGYNFKSRKVAKWLEQSKPNLVHMITRIHLGMEISYRELAPRDTSWHFCRYRGSQIQKSGKCGQTAGTNLAHIMRM